MHRQRNSEGAFRRRPDRSMGWAARESKLAAALGRELAPGGALVEPSSEIGLAPFAPPPRRRGVGAFDVARAVLAWVLALHLCYLAATAILISVYRFVDPPATVLMAYRKWRFGWKIEAPRPVRLAKVPKYVRRMLVSIEDYKFYEHHGIDMEAFARAREINKRLGKPLYGGSTLTMQVARTLFLVPEKSYLRKYLEVLTAFELEAILSKDRILELYFGYAEWGKGLFGIEDASRKWYGSGISEISRDEATRLISLLSSPIKYGPGTIYKSRILSERYSFLSYRYDSPPAEASSASGSGSGPQAEAPGSGTPAVATGTSGEQPATGAIPPPSAEPESEGEAEGPAEGASGGTAGGAGAAPPAAPPAASSQ
jgi:monofunctional biosynthetic peptidoglycan transglycosylase